MKGRLASDATFLAFAYGLAAVASFVLSIAIGRKLGVAALGTFALGLATVRIAFGASDLGLTTHLTRSVAREPHRSEAYLAGFGAWRLAVIPAVALIAALVAQVHGDGTTLFVLLACGQGLQSVQLLYEGTLLARSRSRAAAVLGALTSTFLLAACGVWWLTSRSFAVFGICYAGAYAAGLAVWATWAGRTLGIWPRPRLAAVALRRELARSWPLGASVLLGLAALRLPLFVLDGTVTDSDLGAYAAVDMFVTAGAVLQTSISAITFPRLAAAYRSDPVALRRTLVLSNAAVLAIGLGITLVLLIAGTQVLAFVFPHKGFGAATALIPVMAWSVPSLLLVQHNLLIFAACDRERANLVFMAGWLVLIAGFQLALVPHYGVIGAAWGLVLARTVGLAALGAVILRLDMHRGGLKPA